MGRKGRSLDQLGLKAQPLARAAERVNEGDPALQEAAWARTRKAPLELFLHAIEEMREDGRWDFADETLTGIYDSASARGDYSLNMMIAVEKIYASKAKHWENEFDIYMKER